MTRILIVDDEPRICNALSMVLRARNYDVDVASSGERALAIAATQRPDLALLDISLPGMSGLEVFRALRADDPQACAVFMTASEDIRTVVDAMRAGAFDYVTKPFDNDDLLLTIERALEMRRLRGEVAGLRETLDGQSVFPDIIGSSSAIRDVLRIMGKAASRDVDVMICGDSGTGKELVARGLHQQHPRRSRSPFVAVNCSAIPATLIESEFFGHERGAFTDAKIQHIGRFEQANGGTLFLDEIGDLPLDTQAKLLRAVQEREVTRVGGSQPIAVDVRIVSATNKDLQAGVAAGTFRDDLYYRLNVVNIRLPSLRERMEDLPLLVRHLIGRINSELFCDVTSVSDEAWARLRAYEWPGNIRELQNALRAAIALADGTTIQARDLPELRTRDASGRRETPEPPTGLTLGDAVDRATKRVERTLIESALARHQGSRGAAAAALGINRKTLFVKMRTLGLLTSGPDEEEGAVN